MPQCRPWVSVGSREGGVMEQRALSACSRVVPWICAKRACIRGQSLRTPPRHYEASEEGARGAQAREPVCGRAGSGDSGTGQSTHLLSHIAWLW